MTGPPTGSRSLSGGCQSGGAGYRALGKTCDKGIRAAQATQLVICGDRTKGDEDSLSLPSQRQDMQTEACRIENALAHMSEQLTPTVLETHDTATATLQGAPAGPIRSPSQ